MHATQKANPHTNPSEIVIIKKTGHQKIAIIVHVTTTSKIKMQ